MTTNWDDDATRHEGPGDPDATRHEGFGDPDATRHEGLVDGDPEATRHEGAAAAASGPGVRWFGSLPVGVTARFEFVRGLSTAGGQADILLCRDRTSGVEVVVKLYRGRPQIDLSTYDKLRTIDPAHVAPLLDLRVDEDGTWEVQEFFPLGSLHDLVQRGAAGGRPARFVEAVLRELTDALAALHAEGITHRDLKPGNVFVRAVEPLDLVLGDFGFARDLTMSSEYMSVVGVFHYTAPEILRGLVSQAADWWSLGVIVYELLTGRSLFVDVEGSREANRRTVQGHLDQGVYSFDDVTDPRWHLLLRGLLNRSKEHRWTDQQIGQWLAGGSPEVVEVAETTALRPARVEPITLPGGTFTDPGAAIESLVADWDAACGYLVGQRVTQLRLWLEKTSAGDVASTMLTAVRNTELSPHVALVQLQTMLLPGRPVVFSGRVVDAATLAAAARGAASGQALEQEWIRALRTHQVLSVLASGVQGGTQLAAADVRLHQYWAELDPLVRRTKELGGLREVTSAVEAPLEGVMLAAALDEELAERHLVAARAVAQRLAPRDPDLLHTAAAASARGSVPASVILEFMGQHVVEAREARDRAEAERARQAEEARKATLAREEAARRRRELRERARRAGQRAGVRLGLSAALVALLIVMFLSQGAGLEWSTLVAAYAPPLVVCVAIAFALETLVTLAPPRVAYAVGAAATVWHAISTVPLTASASQAFEVGRWIAGLPVWFLAGYVVGYVVGLATNRIAGGRASEVNPWVLVPPAIAMNVAVMVLTLNRLGPDAATLDAGPFAVDLAVRVSGPVVAVLGGLPMDAIALLAALVGVVAMATTQHTQRLSVGTRRAGWVVLGVVCLAVGVYFLPVMVLKLWFSLGIALALGAISIGVTAVSS